MAKRRVSDEVAPPKEVDAGEMANQMLYDLNRAQKLGMTQQAVTWLTKTYGPKVVKAWVGEHGGDGIVKPPGSGGFRVITDPGDDVDAFLATIRKQNPAYTREDAVKWMAGIKQDAAEKASQSASVPTSTVKPVQTWAGETDPRKVKVKDISGHYDKMGRYVPPKVRPKPPIGSGSIQFTDTEKPRFGNPITITREMYGKVSADSPMVDGGASARRAPVASPVSPVAKGGVKVPAVAGKLLGTFGPAVAGMLAAVVADIGLQAAAKKFPQYADWFVANEASTCRRGQPQYKGSMTNPRKR